jgi:hypothetical protein
MPAPGARVECMGLSAQAGGARAGERRAVLPARPSGPAPVLGDEGRRSRVQCRWKRLPCPPARCPDSALRSRASFPTTPQHAHIAVGASPGTTSRSTVQFAQALVSDFRAAEMDLAFLSGRPSSGAEQQASRLDRSAVHECVPLTNTQGRITRLRSAPAGHAAGGRGTRFRRLLRPSVRLSTRLSGPRLPAPPVSCTPHARPARPARVPEPRTAHCDRPVWRKSDQRLNNVT